MKKDPNRESPIQRFTLPRYKILRGRKNFQRLFEKSTVLRSDAIQFRYRILPEQDEGLRVAFVAPKRVISRAVHRNIAKRRLKEVYRNHQWIIADIPEKNSFSLHGLFIIQSDNLTYFQTEEQVLSLLNKTRENLIHFKQNPNKFNRE